MVVVVVCVGWQGSRGVTMKIIIIIQHEVKVVLS